MESAMIVLVNCRGLTRPKDDVAHLHLFSVNKLSLTKFQVCVIHGSPSPELGQSNFDLTIGKPKSSSIPKKLRRNLKTESPKIPKVCFKNTNTSKFNTRAWKLMPHETWRELRLETPREVRVADVLRAHLLQAWSCVALKPKILCNLLPK